MPPPVDHVVVLVLENRSFDHMLGFVPHDSPLFHGLTRGGPYTNPPWRSSGPPTPATPDAKPVLPVDPNHSHDAVIRQLRLGGLAGARRPGRGLAPPTFEGLLGPLANWWFRRNAGANPVTDRGGLIMRCQPPSQVPVLATLALQFGVCSKWFASVPGETWPNRNFLHAATSDSTTDNEIRFYTDPTIFELLEDHGKTWRIYYDDTPQVWAFRRLWEPTRLPNWFPFPEFARHVQQGQLPSYAFIEPNTGHPSTHRRRRATAGTRATTSTPATTWSPTPTMTATSGPATGTSSGASSWSPPSTRRCGPTQPSSNERSC